MPRTHAQDLKNADLFRWAMIGSVTAPHNQAGIVDNTNPDAVAKFKRSPGYSAFFADLANSTAGADRSILSPAAYYADLARFIDANITDKNKLPAEQQLFTRRQDLQDIGLSKENTEHTVPYVQLVNKIMVDWLGNRMPTQEYERKTQQSESQILAKIATLNFAAGPPYNVHFATIIESFRRMKLDLATLYEKTGIDCVDVATAQLGWSPEAKKRLTLWDKGISWQDEMKYLGDTIPLDKAAEMIGISTGEMHDLVYQGFQPSFVTDKRTDSPDNPFQFLDGKTERSFMWVNWGNPNALPLEIIPGTNIGTFQVGEHFFENERGELPAKFAKAMGGSYYKIADHNDWIMDKYSIHTQMEVFESEESYGLGDAPTKTCAICADRGYNLKVFDTSGKAGFSLTNIQGESHIPMLQIFCRQAKALGFTFAELDWLKCAVNAQEMRNGLDLPALLMVKQLRDKTKWPIDEIAAFLFDIKTIATSNDGREKSLFDRLFQNEAFTSALPKAALNNPNVLKPAEKDGASAQFLPCYDEDKAAIWTEYSRNHLDNKLRAALCGIFGLTSEELDSVADMLALRGPDVALTISNLTGLYRMSRLPKLLNLSLEDTVSLVTFMDLMEVAINGTTLCSNDYDARGGMARAYEGWRADVIGGKDYILPRLIEAAEFLKTNKISAFEMAFITGTIADSDVQAEFVKNGRLDPQYDFAQLAALLKQIREADVALTITPDTPIMASIPKQMRARAISSFKSFGFIDANGLRHKNPFPEDMKQDLQRFLLDETEPIANILIREGLADGPELSILNAKGLMDDYGRITDKFDENTDLAAIFPPYLQENITEIQRAVLEDQENLRALADYFAQPVEDTALAEFHARDQLSTFLSISAEQLDAILSLVAKVNKTADAKTIYYDEVDKPFMDAFHRLIFATKKLNLEPELIKCLEIAPDILAKMGFNRSKLDPDKADLKTRLRGENILCLIQHRATILKAFEVWGDDLAGNMRSLEPNALAFFAKAKGFDEDVAREIAPILTRNKDKPNSIGISPAKIEVLERLNHIFAMADQAGLTPQSLMRYRALVDMQMSYESEGQAEETAEIWQEYSELSALAQSALRNKVSDKEWQTMSKAITGVTDRGLRAALIEPVLWVMRSTKAIRDGYGDVKTPSDLYAYFLIDVEADGATDISPIKQGLNAMQLYVHRCNMGLEPSVKTAVPMDRWAWMSHYRVWEANRRVFLYPENYLDPALRRTKTPLFKTFESQLLQGSLSDGDIEASIAQYLKKFEALSRLRIVDACVSKVKNPADERKIYFLAADDKNTGRDYYLRSADIAIIDEKDRVLGWEPWVPVKLKIKADDATIVQAFDRIFVFWVEREVRKVQIPQKSTDNAQREAKYIKDKQGRDVHHVGYATIKYSYQAPDGTWVRPRILMPEQVVIDPQAIHKVGKWVGDIDLFEHRVWHSVVAKTVIEDGKERIIISYGNKNAKDLDDDDTGDANIHLLYLDPVFACHIGHDLVSRPIADITPYAININEMSGPQENGTELNASAYCLSVRDEPRYFITDNEDSVFLFMGHANVYDALSAFAADGELLSRYTYKFGPISFGLSITALQMSTSSATHMARQLLAGGVEGLLTRNNQLHGEKRSEHIKLNSLEVLFSHPEQGCSVPILGTDYPSGEGPLDFFGSHSQYFWEIFFHMPVLIAKSLNSQGKFKEAQKWLHFVFDPSAAQKHASEGKDAYWNFVPFLNLSQSKIDQMLEDPSQISAYRKDPLDPHAIAQLRPDAYRRSVVMDYIDNLIDWGDSLFAERSWEALGQARMLYLMARDLLGERPNLSDAKLPKALTIGQLKNQSQKAEARRQAHLRELAEYYQGLIDDPDRHKKTAAEEAMCHSFDLDDLAYFSVPENKGFLDYWDRVEDRLYKVRHGEDLSGKEMHLALFQPELDPAALSAAGIGSNDSLILSTVPNYRFTTLIEKAKSATSHLIQLGNTLMGVLEKKDGEALALFRNQHEMALLNLSTELMEHHIDEAQATLDSLQASLASAQDRDNYYAGLQDRSLLPAEKSSLQEHIDGIESMSVALGIRLDAVVAHLVPTIYGFSDGGFQPGTSVSEAAALIDGTGQISMQQSAIHATWAQYRRREEDWALQRLLAQHEAQVVSSQIIAAQKRVDVAVKNQTIHEQTLRQNEDMRDFLEGKFTSIELYTWAASQIKTLYGQAFALAQDLSASAQSAFQFELDSKRSFVHGVPALRDHKGLFAGEALLLSLNTMEQAYLEQDERRLEIEKSISLLSLAPEEFIALKETGECRFALTEQLFDYDFAGHYCRKIKSITVSVLAMVGPYQNVQATLTQTDNMIVLQPDFAAVQQLLAPEDSLGQGSANLISAGRANQQIAISKAIEDGGMFHPDFNDRRYGPFEGTGAISGWKLSMPKKSNRFNFNAISDVIIKVKYSAKAGPSSFANDVQNAAQIANYSGHRLVSLRHEFNAEWLAAQSTGQLKLPISERLFPANLDLTSFAFGDAKSGKQGTENVIQLLAVFNTNKESAKLTLNGKKVDATSGNVTAPQSMGDWLVGLNGAEGGFKDLDNIVMILPYRAAFL